MQQLHTGKVIPFKSLYQFQHWLAMSQVDEWMKRINFSKELQGKGAATCPFCGQKVDARHAKKR